MSQSTLQNSASQRAGAHTIYKENLKAELHTRVSGTVRTRAGPSWDERLEKSVKGFQVKAKATEDEQNKALTECIEKGRSRATSAPFRDSALAPDGQAMLLARKKKMHDLEQDYKGKMMQLKDKMEKREPLFRLGEVNAAFAMQRERAVERKREMQQDERERWEHLRSVEESASSRPLLIEDPHYRAPKKKPPTKSASSPNVSGIDASVTTNPAIFGGREEYEKDIKIRDAISQPWFQNSDWAQTVREIKDRADNRQKLHEISYPNPHPQAGMLTRGRLMHTLPAQVPAVY